MNMKRNVTRWIILSILIGIVIASILVDIFAGSMITESNAMIRLQPPSFTHFFGTDGYGRDVFLRVLSAAKISIVSSLVVVVVAASIGIFTGMVSGYFEGILDEGLMMICDLFLAFPQMILAIVIAGVFQGGLFSAMVALTLSDWMVFARITRSSVLKQKQELYVTASKFSGLSDFEILWRHILPNIRNLLMVTFTLNFASMLLNLASLSFLGIGVKIPTAEWGSMISEGRQYLNSAPWIVVFPCIAIFTTVLLIHLLSKTFEKNKGERNAQLD